MKLIIIMSLFLSQAFAGGTEDFLRKYKIKLIPENMNPELVRTFGREIRLFPAPLMEEMLSQGAQITLIEGWGVTEDPTFLDSTTFDGRSWSDVPGSGGYPPARRPTRIVVNRLDYRGSANLFLHEHAHALNSLYRFQGLTKSRAWKALIARNPEAKQFLLGKCGAYCLSNDDETFAELFAIYHSGGRRMLETASPEMAEFFRTLNSVKNFTRNKTL